MAVRPRYRDLTIFGRVYTWQDVRDGASALVATPDSELDAGTLARIYRIARNNEIEVSARRPLIVYGGVSLIGETDTFHFVQISPQEVTATEKDVRAEWRI